LSTPERHSWRPAKQRKLFTANHFLSALAQRRTTVRGVATCPARTYSLRTIPAAQIRVNAVTLSEATRTPGVRRVVKSLIAIHTMHSIFAMRMVAHSGFNP